MSDDRAVLYLGDRVVHWWLTREQAAAIAQMFVQSLGPANGEGDGNE